MTDPLDQALGLVAQSRALAGFSVHRSGGELHLSKDGESFARLIPAGESGQWHIESFHNLKRWERVDFQGPLEACLDLLADRYYDIYWEQ